MLDRNVRQRGGVTVVIRASVKSWRRQTFSSHNSQLSFTGLSKVNDWWYRMRIMVRNSRFRTWRYGNAKMKLELLNTWLLFKTSVLNKHRHQEGRPHPATSLRGKNRSFKEKSIWSQPLKSPAKHRTVTSAQGNKVKAIRGDRTGKDTSKKNKGALPLLSPRSGMQIPWDFHELYMSFPWAFFRCFTMSLSRNHPFVPIRSHPASEHWNGDGCSFFRWTFRSLRDSKLFSLTWSQFSKWQGNIVGLSWEEASFPASSSMWW